jgi:hypothetical protein
MQKLSFGRINAAMDGVPMCRAGLEPLPVGSQGAASAQTRCREPRPTPDFPEQTIGDLMEEFREDANRIRASFGMRPIPPERETVGMCPECGSPIDSKGRCVSPARHGGLDD